MKTLCTILMLLLTSPAFSIIHKYNGLRCDRMLHFSGGYMMTLSLDHYGDYSDNFISRGMVASFLLGYAKEAADSGSIAPWAWWNYRRYDKYDCYYDLGSVILGSICARFLTYEF